MKITLAITGASGIPLAFALLKELVKHDAVVRLILSKAGIVTVKHEVELSLSASPDKTKEILLKHLAIKKYSDNLMVFGNEDWFAPMASGSNVSEVTIVCPCSMATLAKISHGIADDLITRSCDVALKERKNLILVPREMPFSAIHLKNMHKLAKLDVAIMPPNVAFYNHPQTIAEMLEFFVAKILDQAGINNQLMPRWAE